MSKKNMMSRRLQRQYSEIINGGGGNWYYPFGWGKKTDRECAAWAAFHFYKEWGGKDGVDFYRIQRVVLKGSTEAIYRWAREVPQANKKKCERIILNCGDPAMLRKFAMNIPGARAEMLESMAIISEVLSM